MASPVAITWSIAGGIAACSDGRAAGDHVADRDLFERAAGEGLFAGQALVEHAGQGVDVGAGVDLAGAETLGGHVRPRADGRVLRRQPGVVGGAGDAEVDEVREVVGVHQDVGRFDVAMHQPGLMGAVQSPRDLVDERHRAFGLERAASIRVCRSVPLISRMVTYRRPSTSPTS